MGTLCPEKSCTHQKRLREELTNGRDLATQLQIMLQNPSKDHGSVSSEDLVMKILRSYTECLCLVSSSDSDEFGQIPAITQVGSPSSGDLGSVDSGERPPAVKDRKGGYKRRKVTGDSWVRVSHAMEDEYAWRKYGQKEILHAQFPRCYFRCTHKNDKGCKATKQVQRIQEDPNTYHTTYFGHHTCRDQLKASQNISPSNHHVEPFLLSFESKIPRATSTTKDQEFYKEETKSDVSENISSLDSIVWPDLMPLESSTAPHGFEEMDFLNYFHDFEENEFLG